MTLIDPRFYFFLFRSCMLKVRKRISAYRFEIASIRASGKTFTLRKRVGQDVWVPTMKGLDIGADVFLGDRVEIIGHPDGRIRLAGGVRLGSDSRLSVVEGDSLQIGQGTTIHGAVHLVGNIKVGQNCLFARNIFMSSHTHLFAEDPYELIKNQDLLFQKDRSRRSLEARIEIGDDCWIGWGVVVRHGVRVGKGSIIAANSVVTKDIPPYSVAGGAPARILKARVEFIPQSFVDSSDRKSTPYFYSGFDQKPPHKNPKGILVNQDFAEMILKTDASKKMKIEGYSDVSQKVFIRAQGVDIFAGSVEKDFSIFCDLPAQSSQPEEDFFRGGFAVQILTSGSGGLWIRNAELMN